MGGEHNEARWVAFTQYTTGGRTWNVTIREGMDLEQVNAMINVIADATDAIGGVMDQVHAPPLPAAPEPRNGPGSSQNAGGSQTTRGGVFGRPEPSQGPSGAAQAKAGPQVTEVSKVIVTGTRDAPLVEMYSPNEKLKFAVFKVPANRVAGLLQDRYPQLTDADTNVFFDCGNQFPVAWQVHWEPSPKNAKWKDLITIVQDDLEV